MELAGRERRIDEKPLTQLHPPVQHIAEGIRPYLDAPFAFFGHSMGTLLGFEVCHYLRERHQPAPVHLFVSARCAPHITARGPAIHHLYDQALPEKLREFGGLPDDFLENRELVNLVLPALKADFAICETYRYKESGPLDCPITALGGLQDESLSREDLMEWRKQSGGPFTWRLLPGGHFFIRTVPNLVLSLIAEQLAGVLDSTLRL